MTISFTKQVHSERSKHDRSNKTYVSHEKYILNLTGDALEKPEMKDVVVCLIVRRVIPSTMSVADLEDLTDTQAVEIEEDLRDMSEEYGWLR